MGTIDRLKEWASRRVEPLAWVAFMFIAYTAFGLIFISGD